MKKNRRTCIKIAAVMLVALLVTIGLWTPAQQTIAGGSVNVTLASIDKLPDGTEFTLNLYKVGEWIHTEDGKAVLQLDDDLATEAKVERIIVYESEDDAEALLESSNNVGNYIKAYSNKFTSLGTKTVKAGDATGVVFDGLADNGLYIITGDTESLYKIKKRWTPTSVYVRLLNGPTSMELNSVKMTSAPIIDEYSIIKTWQVEDQYKAKESKVRPTSVDVKISFGNQEIDTITLNDGNDWMYSWKADESDTDEGVVRYITGSGDNEKSTEIKLDPKNKDMTWHVTEVADNMNVRYTADITEPSEDRPGTYQIENKYDVTELEITKNLDGYVDAGSKSDLSNLTFAFKITGYIDGEDVYHNTAGLTFNKGDDLSRTVTIIDIPSAIEKFEVEEVYSAGYTPKVKTITNDTPDEDGVWRFEFDNTHGPGQGFGVVNKYEDGKFTGDEESAPDAK